MSGESFKVLIGPYITDDHTGTYSGTRLDSLIETARVLRDPVAVDAISAGVRDIAVGEVASTEAVRQAILRRSE